jgi:hypothetical protein
MLGRRQPSELVLYELGEASRGGGSATEPGRDLLLDQSESRRVPMRGGRWDRKRTMGLGGGWGQLGSSKEDTFSKEDSVNAQLERNVPSGKQPAKR